jgi:hypothetical protein
VTTDTARAAVALAVLLALGGCATMEAGPDAAMARPEVKLERVEVASYFPYAAPPARVPLILAFVFNVTNPGSRPITLEELRFAYGFEAKPGQFFVLNSPAVYDTVHIPARATNTVRVVSVLDSAIVPATLAVTQGFRMQALQVRAPDLVKAWWETIGDFPYAIQVSEGVATFTAGRGSTLVTFEHTFRKS